MEARLLHNIFLCRGLRGSRDGGGGAVIGQRTPTRCPFLQFTSSSSQATYFLLFLLIICAQGITVVLQTGDCVFFRKCILSYPTCLLLWLRLLFFQITLEIQFFFADDFTFTLKFDELQQLQREACYETASKHICLDNKSAHGAITGSVGEAPLIALFSARHGEPLTSRQRAQHTIAHHYMRTNASVQHIKGSLCAFKRWGGPQGLHCIWFLTKSTLGRNQ